MSHDRLILPLRILTLGAFVLLASCAPSNTPTGSVLYYNNYVDMALSSTAETYPSLKLTQQTPPDGMDVVLLSQLGDSRLSVPDFLSVECGYAYQQSQKAGNFYDLTSQWSQSEISKGQWKGLDPVLKAGVKGFLPTAAYWYGLYYKPQFLQTQGLKIPATLEELRTFAEAAKAKGLIPFALGTNTGWPAVLWFSYLDLRINGAAAYEALIKGERSFDSPSVIEVLKVLQEFRDKGYFSAKSGETTWEEGVSEVVQQKAALILMGAYISDRVPQISELSFSSFPQGPVPNRSELISLSGYAFPVRGANFFGAFHLAQAYRAKGAAGLTQHSFQIPLGPNINPGTAYKSAGADLLSKADNFYPSLEKATPPQFSYSMGRLFAAFFTPGLIPTAQDLASKLEFIRKN